MIYRRCKKKKISNWTFVRFFLIARFEGSSQSNSSRPCAMYVRHGKNVSVMRITWRLLALRLKITSAYLFGVDGNRCFILFSYTITRVPRPETDWRANVYVILTIIFPRLLMDFENMRFSRDSFTCLLVYLFVRLIFFHFQLWYTIYLHNLPYCMQISNAINIYESRRPIGNGTVALCLSPSTVDN